MDASSSDLGRAIVATIAGGVLGGLAMALIVWILWGVRGLGWIGPFIVAALFIVAGVPMGELVRRAANRSMDSRVRMLAGFGVFLIYAVATMIAWQLSFANAFLNLFALIGMAMGVWTAMNRVRE